MNPIVRWNAAINIDVHQKVSNFPSACLSASIKKVSLHNFCKKHLILLILHVMKICAIPAKSLHFTLPVTLPPSLGN